MPTANLNTTTRRAMLATAAATIPAALVGSPMIALAGRDPIHELIDNHRFAYRAYETMVIETDGAPGSSYDAAWEAYSNARDELLTTPPTSALGIALLLSHVVTHMEAGNTWDQDNWIALCESIRETIMASMGSVSAV